MSNDDGIPTDIDQLKEKIRNEILREYKLLPDDEIKAIRKFAIGQVCSSVDHYLKQMSYNMPTNIKTKVYGEKDTIKKLKIIRDFLREIKYRELKDRK